MLLPLFMAFLISRESHGFIIKSHIYRSNLDCKSEPLSWLFCLHVVCHYYITGIQRQADQCQYSLRLVVYTFSFLFEYYKFRKIVLNCTAILFNKFIGRFFQTVLRFSSLNLCAGYFSTCKIVLECTIYVYIFQSNITYVQCVVSMQCNVVRLSRTGLT